MKLFHYITFSAFILIAGWSSAWAQDIEQMRKAKPFEMRGGIGGGSTFYSSNEPFESRDPFTWNIHGSLRPSIYGFSIPLSFVVTQYSKSYRNPFTQFGISPEYKWIKLHLGYRTMSFSPTVFEGHSFLGAGLELNPGSFYIGGFYGRLNKAISEDTTLDRRVQPQYGRDGYGLKVGLKDKKKEFTLMYFRAQDDTASIWRQFDTVNTYKPQDNSVFGSNWQFRFLKNFRLSGNASASILARDLSYEKIEHIGDFEIPSAVHNVAPVTYSSVFSWAGQGQLAYTQKTFNALLGYRRIQPDFKSLGVPYMLNDLEMWNANIGSRFNKGKINVNGSFTTQHNNLSKKRSSELVSSTGNLNVNTFINQYFNLNMNLTGVRLNQKDGLLKLTDSMRLNQLMLTAVVSPAFNFTKSNKQHTISSSLSYTKLDDRNPATTEYASADNLNANLNYSLFFLNSYLGINSGITYSEYQQTHSSYQSAGVNVGATAQLLKSRQLVVQGDVGYFLNKSTDSPTGDNITFSVNGNYNASRRHSFGVYASYIITPPIELDPVNEIYKVPFAVNSRILSGGITYSYSF